MPWIIVICFTFQMNARYSVGLQYGSHQVVLKSRAAAGHIIGAHPQAYELPTLVGCICEQEQ